MDKLQTGDVAFLLGSRWWHGNRHSVNPRCVEAALLALFRRMSCSPKTLLEIVLKITHLIDFRIVAGALIRVATSIRQRSLGVPHIYVMVATK